MSETLVATGATEIIEALVVDVSNVSLTGLTDIKADVRRKSDGKVLDWNDNTFKTVGWTTRQQTLTETDAVNQPGWYRLSWDMSTIVSPSANDVYTVTIRQTTLTNAANCPQSGVIRVAAFIDTIASNLNATVSSRATQAQILSDATPFQGARIDASISSRSTLTQAQIISDSVPFLGARIDASISSRSTLTQVQIVSDGVPFLGARVDAAISSRATQAQILSDATPFQGARIDASISSRSTLTQVQVVSDGVPFLGARIDAAISSRATPQNITDLQIHGDANWETAIVPTAAAVAAAVWATAEGSSTMGASLGLLRRRTTNRAKLSALGVWSFYADDGVTVEKTSTVTDKDALSITLAAGEPAQRTAES